MVWLEISWYNLEDIIMERLERVSQGHCPNCGSADINYGTSELSGESIYYEADCNECKSFLHEWYDLKFSGFD